MAPPMGCPGIRVWTTIKNNGDCHHFFNLSEVVREKALGLWLQAPKAAFDGLAPSKSSIEAMPTDSGRCDLLLALRGSVVRRVAWAHSKPRKCMIGLTESKSNGNGSGHTISGCCFELHKNKVGWPRSSTCSIIFLDNSLRARRYNEMRDYQC
jgi:hypothetical protein